MKEPYFQIKGQYSRTNRKRRAIESMGKVQIDFLAKSINLPKKGHVDWQDINVVGEFTISRGGEGRKDKFVQFSRSVREVFFAQPLRRFLHGFCLFQEEFELWGFDRSGAYGAGLQSIVDDKEMLIRAISSYILLSNEELRRDTSITQNGEEKFDQFSRSGEVPGPSIDFESGPIVQPMRLITRGMTCYKAKDESKVIKYSWSSAEKNTEFYLLN